MTALTPEALRIAVASLTPSRAARLRHLEDVVSAGAEDPTNAIAEM
ncbi:hypothetical protein ABZY14_28120 [Streptomyces sp. NPDC006617]